MSISINTNLSALNAQRKLDGTTKALTAPPSLTFTAPADSSSTKSGSNGVPVQPGFTVVTTSGAVNVQLTDRKSVV